MALGAVVVRPHVNLSFPEPLEPLVHYMPASAMNVVETCRELLNAPMRMERIATEAAGYFERNFTAAAIARRMLGHMAKVVAP